MGVLCQILPTPLAISCPHIGWGTPVAYAASDREVALEGEGDNSPFATGLTRPNELTGRIQMPVSKKRRREKSNPQSSKGSSTRVALPDRRAMEGFMAAIGGRQANDAIAETQRVMYDAWDHTNSRARIALAHKALTISPLCADAYVLLAEEDAKSADAALEYYRKVSKSRSRRSGLRAC